VQPYLTNPHGCEYTSIAVGVIHWFNTFSPTKGVTWRFFRAVTGWKITRREWYKEIAPRILHIQRAALLLGGPDLKWIPLTNDDSPPRFYERSHDARSEDQHPISASANAKILLNRDNRVSGTIWFGENRIGKRKRSFENY